MMKLDGKSIPTPFQDIGIDYIEISRTERMASGRLVKDIIATKKKFTLTYKGLTPEHIQIFLDIYLSGREVEFEYEDFKGTEKVTVLIMSIPRELYSPKPQYSKNITVVLEEV